MIQCCYLAEQLVPAMKHRCFLKAVYREAAIFVSVRCHILFYNSRAIVRDSS